MEGASERIFTGGFTLVLQLFSGVSKSSEILIECLLGLSLLLGIYFLIKRQISERDTVLEERKLAELELRKLAQMVDFANDTIVVRDLSDQIIYWNQGAERLYGWTKPEVLGKHIHTFLNTVFPNQLEEIRTEFCQKGYWEGELIHTIRDGKKIIVASRWTLQRDENHQPIAILEINNNITDRKLAEEALKNAKEELELRVQERTQALTAEIAERKETEKKLEQTMEHLKRSNQELERFAFVAAHDLQEPLRAITGYTQLLTQEYPEHLDSSIREYMGYIVEGSTRMQHLVRDLLIYYRVGSVTRSFVPTDCNAIVQQVVDRLQPSITESKAIVIYENLPTVSADKTLFLQLFQNLIDNAIKFRASEIPRVRVTAEFTKNHEWLFCVSDNGIGIKQRYLERIFEIFKRLHTHKKFPGTGIGLAICKKIVEHHGGQIWVESEIGVGTKFYFTIPPSDAS
ncbi:sensor histidine kinase [Scytonema sp. NUACC26]|uniref:sensor histidine kinase n=1 Tax=Scytonema sp. NUACC26 TaxID=3140176 RepID=UPI0034DBF639